MRRVRSHRRSSELVYPKQILVPRQKPGPFLDAVSTVDAHGDTMFNLLQLERLGPELDGIATAHPQLRHDVDSLKEIIGSTVAKHGYLWLSGD